MWAQIKKWFGKGGSFFRRSASGAAEHDLKWCELGEENPFGVPFLDVRDVTWNMVATTGSLRVAESYKAQRQSDGREFIGAEIEDAATVLCDLTFPHNGAELEGIAYKADSMDVKWDIYVYDSVFLFVRSWTGQLEYRGFAEVGKEHIRIYRIETSRESVDTAPQAVYFILGTHAMGKVLPHTIPPGLPKDAGLIAQWSFTMYGRFACYATYHDVSKIEIRIGKG